MRVQVISNITKVYPNMIKVIIYKEPILNTISGGERKRREVSPDDNILPSYRSLRRSRVSIKDIIYSNKFEYFCTFTFDPKKHDRYNISYCKLVMLKWFRNQKDHHSPHLKYICIPELHKDGAVHFHALIANFNGKLKDSGHKTQQGNIIYNLTGYRAGLSTASPLDGNIDGVANYVAKYVTKGLVSSFNHKRYFCSRNLSRPLKIRNSSLFRKTLPLFRKQVADFDNIQIYDLQKF